MWRHCCAQVEAVKDTILAKRAYWKLNGLITEPQLLQMLEDAGKVSEPRNHARAAQHTHAASMPSSD